MAPASQPEEEPVAAVDTQKKPAPASQALATQDLFPRVFPDLGVLVFPFRFLGYWLARKVRAEDPKAPKAHTIVDGIIFGEGPRFRPATNELYFVDMFGQQVLKYSLETKKSEVVYHDSEDLVSGLGWLPDGRMLITSMNKRCVLVHDEATKTTEVYADVKAHTRFRVNDMVVSTSGRAYLGSFGFDISDLTSISSSALVSIGTDGTSCVEATGVVFPNGMVITPDGKTLISAETFAGRLTAYDIGDDGKLNNQRLWADVGGFTDGICLDAEGCVWTSIVQSGIYPTGGGLLRVQEGGRILEVLGFGANGIKNNVFACQLATDADGKHQLFFMEAVTNYESVMLKDGPEAARKNGLLRSIEVSVGPARMAGNDKYCGGYC